MKTRRLVGSMCVAVKSRSLIGAAALAVLTVIPYPMSARMPEIKAAAKISLPDWAAITQEHERQLRIVVPVQGGGGYHARSRSQNWLARFDRRGFALTPDQGTWRWGLDLIAYGFDGATRSVGNAEQVEIAGDQATYRRDAILREWFINRSDGLEQGFTLTRRPSAGVGPLQLQFAIRGSLVPHVSDDGRSTVFEDFAAEARVRYSGLQATDSRGHRLPARMKTVRDKLIIEVEERGAVYPIRIDPIAQQAYLKASNTNAFDKFGFAIAISGDTAVVGAPGEGSCATGVNGDQFDNSCQNSGAAYVFVRNAGVWSQQAYLKASNTQAGYEFGAAVAISGDTIVVGSHLETSSSTGINSTPDTNMNGAGAAYVFARSGGAWYQQAYLKGSVTNLYDEFGYSVSVSGNTVAVGVPAPSTLNDRAYVFVSNGGVWSQQQVFPSPNPSGEYGYAVGVDANTLVIGAGSQQNIQVFQNSGGIWSAQATLTGSNTPPSSLFGNAVAISGNTIVAGDTRENNGSGYGVAYVFVLSNATWTQQARLLASNPAGQIGFGYSVAISGDTLVVGAPFENSSTTGVDSIPDNNGSWTGAAYSFQRSGSVWSQQAYIKASNPQDYYEFGSSVSISQGTIISGSIYESSNATGVNGNQASTTANSAGAAYVFAPLSVNITVNTSPQGLLFNSSGAGCAPGSSYVAPQILSWTPGAACTLSVSTPQNGNVFSHWEDASTNPVRSITAPVSDTTYTATFTPPHMAAQAGATPQSTPVNTAFPNPLAVVVADSLGNPVPGISVTFTAPATGASGVFSNTTNTITVITDASGVAAAPFTANPTAGGPYLVIASATGLTSVNFSLTNTPPANPTVTITVPTGIGFTFAGVAYTGSQSISIAAGSYTLTTTSPQSTGAGSQAVFVSWSDGGAISHTVNVSSSISIAATFATQNLLTTAASPVVGGSVSPASGYFDSTATVPVTAAANPGYAFAGWSGDCTGAGACSVNMSAPRNVTANFNPTVTITVPAGISFTFAGVPYTGSQIITIAAGSYTLTTTSPQSTGAASQAVFVSWSDGGAISHTVSVAAPVSITGTFKTQNLLTTAASPAVGGSVSPASGYFDSTATVPVTATANPGFAFANWSGDCSGAAACSVNMSAPRSVTANFNTTVTITVPAGISFTFAGVPYTGSQVITIAAGSYTLATTSPQSTGAGSQAVFVSWSDGGAISHTVSVAAPVSITGTFKTQNLLSTAASPAVGGSVSPASGYFDSTATVPVTATANAGFAFASWSGDCSGAAACSVNMSAPRSVTANFNATVTVTVPAGISFTFAGVPYTGSQVISIAPGIYSLATTSPQLVTATSQSVFVSWSDGGGISHSITVGSSPISITGVFKTQYYLTTAVSPAGDGTISPPSGFFDSTATVPVTATANPGFIFGSWSGACVGTGPCSVSMASGPKTVTANFTLPLFPVTINVPAGIQFAFNGSVYTGAHTIAVAPGTYPLSTPSPQSIAAGIQAAFVSWSDGGGQSHALSVSGPTAVTGAFQIQYLLTTTATPSNEGTVTLPPGGPWYNAGTPVIVGALANPGYEFDYWGADCSGSALSCFLVMNAPHSAVAHFGVQQNWVQLFPGTSPSPRYLPAMAYDALHQQVVLFGGVTQNALNGHLLSDTWLWNGSTWGRQNPVKSPPPRWGAAMTYDAARNQVVLFGGITVGQGGTVVDDPSTWIWDLADNTWIEKNVPGPDPANWGGSMAYDALHHQVVYFEPLRAFTWVWNGVSWNNVTPGFGPAARQFAPMAYDPAIQRVVLYGGQTSAAPVTQFTDTWEWDGANWSRMSPVSTPPAGGSGSALSMSYNPASEELILLASDFTTSTLQTWAWDGTNWSQKMPVTSPSYRSAPVMTYDAARSQILLFGGESGSTGNAINDTWAWLTPNVSLLPQTPVVTASGGSVTVSVALANSGNVPDTSVILGTTTLGSATNTGGGFIADINPGTNGTISVTFKASAVGTGVQLLTMQGIYNANGVIGIPWSLSQYVWVP